MTDETPTTRHDDIPSDLVDCPKCGAMRFWPSGRCMQGCDNFIKQKPKASRTNSIKAG